MLLFLPKDAARSSLYSEGAAGGILEEEGFYPALAFGRRNSFGAHSRLQRTPLPVTFLVNQIIKVQSSILCPAPY